MAALAGQGSLVTAFQVLSGLAFGAALPFLISLLYGSKSQGVTPFAIGLLPGFTLAGVGTVAECYLRGCGDVTPGIVGRCGGWIVLVLLGWRLFHIRGPMGLAYATSIVQGLTACWLCLCLYRNLTRHNRAHGDLHDNTSGQGVTPCPA